MTLRAIKPPHETRTRILDAAEELFMQHGFEGTSMRQLTAKAGANLAAVNYHFGSKDALIEAVFRRRLDPMNASRIAELDRLEKEAGGKALSPQQIIGAFVGASLRMIEDAKNGGRNFIRLLGRTYTDPQKHIRSRRAHLAHAFHVRHARLHAGGHRHGATDRRLQARRPLRRAPAGGAAHRIPCRGPASAAARHRRCEEGCLIFLLD
jgi:AcrR family transcriptional regulator